MKVKVIRKKIKNTYLKFEDKDTLIITTGKRINQSEINDILKSKKKWIEKQQNKMNAFPSFVSSLDEKYVKILGKSYKIKIISSDIDDIEIFENDILIKTKTDEIDYICHVIEQFLKSYFLCVLNELSYECIKKANENDITFDGNFKLRKMKTRFASISKHTNTIYLNTLLIKYDIDTIKSVIFHELCHTKHMNHQRKFYELLYRVCPNYNLISKKLKDTFFFNQYWFLSNK